MKMVMPLLVAGALLFVVGCKDKKDPRDRPGFVDTSDPSKVLKTMTPPPKAKGNSAMGAGAVPPPSK
jgi:hypothetical protein